MYGCESWTVKKAERRSWAIHIHTHTVMASSSLLSKKKSSARTITGALDFKKKIVSGVMDKKEWRLVSSGADILPAVSACENSKEIKPVHPKGNQPWIFTGRTDAEAEAPIHWPPDVKSQLIAPDAGEDWRQEEKRVTGWNGRMALPTQWAWVWANSGREWRTEEPGVLQSTGSQVGHNLATEQQQ